MRFDTDPVGSGSVASDRERSPTGVDAPSPNKTEEGRARNRRVQLVER